MWTVRALAGALTFAVVAALAACGLGSAESRQEGVELRVTRGFGQERIHATARRSSRGDDTALRFVQAERRVETGFGGGSVESIDGIEGGGSSGGPDWFYFVNGLEGSVAAAERKLYPGDVVQWDYRRRGAAMSIPAIVGAYPEPLLSGIEGRRLPVRIECADDGGRACREVERRLSDDGVTASVGSFGDGAG